MGVCSILSHLCIMFVSILSMFKDFKALVRDDDGRGEDDVGGCLCRGGSGGSGGAGALFMLFSRTDGYSWVKNTCVL